MPMNLRRISFFSLLFLFMFLSCKALGYPPVLYGLVAMFIIFYLALSFSYKIFCYLFWFFLISIAIYLPQELLYGHISTGIVASLMETNFEESIEYLHSIPIYVFIIEVLYIVLGLAILYLAKNQAGKKVGRYGFLLFLLIIISVLYRPIEKNIKIKEFALSNTRVFFIAFYLDTIELFRDYYIQKDFLDAGARDIPTWDIDSVNPRYPINIIVIGESMRADYLPDYGFLLPITPFLSQAKGRFYHGYVSAGPNTQPSLLRTLYQLTSDKKDFIYENNIISLANIAGFKTYWLSNQGTISQHDTAASRIGYQAKYTFFTKKASYDQNNTQDKALLPIFESCLEDNTSQPKLIVLHLMGSHPDFCKRVNDKVEFNYINHNMSCYLQTIKETDSFLSEVIKKLKVKNLPYSLVYFSDHGLSFKGLNSSKYTTLLVGNETKQNYQIPLIVLSSEDKIHQNIYFRQSAVNFLNGASQWLGIKVKQFEGQPNFWEGTKDKIKVFNWIDWVDFDALKSQPAIPAK